MTDHVPTTLKALGDHPGVVAASSLHPRVQTSSASAVRRQIRANHTQPSEAADRMAAGAALYRARAGARGPGNDAA